MTSNDQVSGSITPSNPAQSDHVQQSAPIASEPKQVQAQPAFKSSTLGKAVSIKGTLAAYEDMLINGRVEGMIELKNNRIEIGESGHVEANTFANVIVISGELKGDVYANEQVIIKKTGRVYGNIFSVDVCIEDGAILKGKIDTARYESAAAEPSAQPSMTIPMSDFHEDDHVKASSLTSLFKKVQEIAHLHSNQPADHTLKMDSDHAAHAFSDIKSNDGSASADAFAQRHCAFPDKTVIGHSVLIKGDLVAEEDVFLQGKLEGVVFSKDHTLEVSSGALLKANVFVKSFILQGDIKGDIHAGDQVRISSSGHLYGNILAPRVVIESGAVVTGTVEMEPQDIEKLFADFMEIATQESLNHMNKSDIYNTNTHHSRRSLNRELGMPKSNKKVEVTI